MEDELHRHLEKECLFPGKYELPDVKADDVIKRDPSISSNQFISRTSCNSMESATGSLCKNPSLSSILEDYSLDLSLETLKSITSSSTNRENFGGVEINYAIELFE